MSPAIRIRSGAFQLPRQNLPPTTPTAPAASPGNARSPGPAGLRPPQRDRSVPSPAHPLPPALRGRYRRQPRRQLAGEQWRQSRRQPSRYDPPSNAPPAAPAAAAPVAPAVDPRANYSSNASQANPATATPSGGGSPQYPNGDWPSSAGAEFPHRSNRALPGRTQPANFPAAWSASGQPSAGGLSLPMPPANQPPAAQFYSPPGRD